MVQRSGSWVQAPFEILGVTAHREGRQHLVVVVVPEADDDDEDEWNDEEEQEDQAEGHCLKPSGDADPVKPTPCDGGVADPIDCRGRDASGRHPSKPMFFRKTSLPQSGRGEARRGHQFSAASARGDGRARAQALGRDELIPFADHVVVLVHHRVPASDVAHAVVIGAAVACRAGLLEKRAVWTLDVLRLQACLPSR